MDDRADWKRRRTHATPAGAEYSHSPPHALPFHAQPHYRHPSSESASSTSHLRSSFVQKDAAVAPSARLGGGGRASGERRSRKGCLTCKNRRKKCPEDFAVRADGNVSCGVCFQKGLPCNAPAPTTAAAGGTTASETRSPTAAAKHDMPPPLSSPLPLPTSAAFSANPHAVSASIPARGFADVSRTTLQKFPNYASQSAYAQPSTTSLGLGGIGSSTTTVTNGPVTMDASWLDDFFKEFSSLSDPIYKDAMWLVNGSSTDANNSNAPVTNISTIPVDAEGAVQNHTSTHIGESTSTSSNAPAPSSAAPNTPGASAPSLSSSQKTGTASAPTNAHDEYDRIVQSHELDLLLERYSPLYEQLWRAVFTSPSHDDGLTRAVIALSRSSKACRASCVSICLSYHHIMQRERERERAINERASLGLAHFLLGNTPNSAERRSFSSSPAAMTASAVAQIGDQGATPASLASDCHKNSDIRLESDEIRAVARSIDWPSHDQGVGLAYKWYQFAMEEYKRSGRSGTLEQRLNCLLNLRWTIIALDGGSAGRVYMEEIRTLISETHVTTGYIRHFDRRGTMLSLILQSALAADIFDAAAGRDQRSAVRLSPTTLTTPSSTSGTTPTQKYTDHTRVHSHDNVNGSTSETTVPFSNLLRRDFEKGPLFEYEFTTCLSTDIIECITLVVNLTMDLQPPSDGARPMSDDERASRCEEVTTAIANAQMSKCDLRGADSVRAMAFHEMWRQTTWIYYFQSIQRLGALAAKVQDALKQILSLADMLSSSVRPSETWDMWMVWFLASTVAVSPDQRAKCLKYMEGLGTEQALLDNMRIVRLLWKRVDETGHCHDWLAIAQENGLSVCYGF